MPLSNRQLVALFVCLLGAACGSDPERLERKFVASGDGFMQAAKPAEAAVEYANAVRADPESGRARFKLAEARLAAGDKRGAVPEFIRAADLLPNDIEAQLRAGHLLLSGGMFEEARTRARRVLQKDSRNITALMMLGNALAGLKNLEDAVTVLERALQTDPERAGIQVNIGVLQLARGEHQAAEEAFMNAVRISGGAPRARLALATFYLARKRLPEAEKELSEARRLDPGDIELNQALASLYIQAGRLADAGPILEEIASTRRDVASRVALASFYMLADDEVRALATLRALAAEPAHFARAKIELAMLHFLRARLPDAHGELDQLLAREPQNARAVTIKARLHLAENKPAVAMARVREAIRLDTRLADAQLTLGRIHLRQRNFVEARRAFSEVITLDPENIAARLELSDLHLQHGELDAAITRVKEALELNGRHLPSRLALLRAISVRESDRLLASELTRSLLAEHPDEPAVHVNLGSLALKRNDAAAARASFTRALQLAPSSHDASAGLIALDLAAGRRDDALQRATRLVADSPNDVRSVLLLADVYGMSGDGARAEQTLRRALQMDPANPSISSMLGAVLMRQQRVGEAIAEFEQLMRLEPESVGAATLLGLLYYSQGRADAAEKWWSRALQIDPRAAAAANNLAWLYAEQGKKLDVALDLASVAKSAYPEVPEVLDTLGWVHFRKGDARSSVRLFEQSIEKDPRNPLYHYHLGRAYADLGEDIRARRSLEQALQLNPAFPQAADAKRAIAGLIF